MSRSAEKFIAKNRITHEAIFNLVKIAIRYLNGEDINVKIGKLSGKWEGFYKIKKGKLRIIAEFDFYGSAVFVDVIDWRGGAYK